MKRIGIAALLAVAVSLLLAVAASGALPKKKATYVGEIKSSPFAMRVTLVVSATGKGLTFTYLCGTGRARPPSAASRSTRPGGSSSHRIRPAARTGSWQAGSRPPQPRSSP